MTKYVSLLRCSFRLFLSLFSSILLADSGPKWTAPKPVPSTSQNVIFPGYNPSLGKIIATWVNGTSPNEEAFSSLFDGSTWSTPVALPVNGVTVNVAINAYDPTIGKSVALWSDASGQPYSSVFDGNVWGSAQPIPAGGGGAALLPFPMFDAANDQLAAFWVDTGGFTGKYSFFDGTNWSAAPSNNPVSNAFLQFPAPLSNNLIVVWVDLGTLDGYSSIFDGTSWSSPQFVGSNIGAPNLIPVLNNASNPRSQTILVAWADNSLPNQVFTSVFDGSNWSTAQAIPGSSVVPGGAVFPVYDPALGQIIAVWPDAGFSAGAYSLFDGQNWIQAQIIPGSDSPSTSFVATYDAALGKIIALWADSLSQGKYSLFYVPSISFSGGGNLQKVANYINQVGQTAAMQPILGKLIRLSQDQLTEALSSISNARNAFFPWVAAETSFGFSQILEDRLAELRWFSFQADQFGSLEKKKPASAKKGLMAAAKDLPQGIPQAASHRDKPYALWVEGLGSFVYQKAQEQNPAYHAQTGSGMLGFDYYRDSIRTIASFAYGSSAIQAAQDSGKGHIDSFAFSWIAEGTMQNAYLEVGCIGAYNRNESHRHIFFPGFDAIAEAKFSTWQAVPHFSIGYDYLMDGCILEPFLTGDCAVLFQDGFSEHGAAPLNVRQPHLTAELFQAQTGLRGYISQFTSWGFWLFQFTGAYQYKKGWGIGRIADVFFVGFPPGYTVISLEQAQNAFVPNAELFIRSDRGIFGSLAYHGEFAGQYIANSILVKLGAFW